MNYYEHHIGDYAAATGHLSLVEDAVYSRMLRRYYLTESPLPTEKQAVARLVGARTPEEAAAVDAVLAEFFTLADDGWHQKRADEDIERYRAKIDAARENGKRGGRPSNKPSEKGSVFLGSENKTQLKAHQTPDTNHQQEQEQKKPRVTAQPAPDDVDPQTWADWLALRKAKRAPVSETVIREARKEAAKAGMAFGQFLAVWCRRGSQGLEADWLKPNERIGSSPPAASKTLSAIQTLQGLKHANVDSRFDSGRPDPLALPLAGPDPCG